MKRIVLVLILILSFFVCSCDKQNDSPADTQEDTDAIDYTDTQGNIEIEEPQETTFYIDTVVDTEPITDDPDEDDDYKNIVLREINLYESQFFAASNSDYYFNFSMPKEWSILSDDNGGYTIMREEIEIGRFYSSAKEGFEEWKTVDVSETQTKDVKIISYIEKCGIGETLEFRRRFCYSYKEGNIEKEIMLTVKYEELSADAERRILNPSFDAAITDTRRGILSDIADGSSILIIGNSFVNTSNVGNILTQMMDNNGKKCKVTAISRSLVTLHSYVNDAVFMKSVEKGKYDAVFACGLYYTSDITNLGKLKAVCDISDTKLVIFPAHNESRSVISAACRKYGKLEILDWKGEIDLLISNGVDKWQMCIKDEYLHSTPIAGYVGAQMIYRAIYGEIPEGGRFASMAGRVLGDYVEIGGLLLVDEKTLNYINYIK